MSAVLRESRSSNAPPTRALHCLLARALAGSLFCRPREEHAQWAARRG